MTIEQRLDRIDKKLNTLVQEAKRPMWVKVTFILEATGWTKERLRQAREQEIIKYEKRDDGIWYDINSLPQIFWINRNRQ